MLNWHNLERSRNPGAATMRAAQFPNNKLAINDFSYTA